MKKTLVILLLVPLLLGACSTVKPEKAAMSDHKKPSIATTTSPKPKPATAAHHPNVALGVLALGADAAWNLFPLFMNAIIP